MKLSNHIAKDFFSSDRMLLEIVEETVDSVYKDKTVVVESVLAGENTTVVHAKSNNERKTHAIEAAKSLLDLLKTTRDTKNYYVTETIIDKLDMLKISKITDGDKKVFDYSVFSQIKEGKFTFILPVNEHAKTSSLVRFAIQDSYIYFFHLEFDKGKETLRWDTYMVPRDKQHTCERYESPYIDKIEPIVYKLLCFVFLSSNEEVFIEAGRKQGTRKQGKIINNTNQNIIILNSNWNVTSIRTEGFSVSGHFALRRHGMGRQLTKMVFIEPYEKHGYTRKAKNITQSK